MAAEAIPDVEMQDDEMQNANEMEQETTIQSKAAALPKDLLGFFWDLAKDEVDARNKAREDLLDALKRSQEAHCQEHPDASTSVNSDSSVAASKSSSKSKSTKPTNHSSPSPASSPSLPMEDRLSKNVIYSLKRLFRGICSSRMESREGFSAALTQLLCSVPEIHINDIKSVLETSLKAPTGASREERTDFRIGYAVAIVVLANSNFISHFDTEELIEMINQLTDHVNSKPIRESALQAIESIASNIPFMVLKNKVIHPALNAIKVRPDSSNNEDNNDEERDASKPSQEVRGPLELDDIYPEALSLLLTLQRIYAENRSSLQLPTTEFGSTLTHPITPSNFEKLAVCLTKSTNSLPNVHPVWITILEHISKISENEKMSVWGKFWQIVVENTLFELKSSYSSRKLGFCVFSTFITYIPTHFSAESKSYISPMFTARFLRSFINNLPDKSTHLFQTAHDVRNTLLRVTTAHPEITPIILSSLIGKFGSQRFDQLTKTSTVEKLTKKIRPEDVAEYIKYLFGQFVSPIVSNDEEEGVETDVRLARIDSTRLWIVDQLAVISRGIASSNDMSNISNILTFLSFHSLFDTSVEPHPPTINSSRKQNKSAKSSITSKQVQNDAFHPAIPKISKRVHTAAMDRFNSLLSQLLPKFTPPKTASERENMKPLPDQQSHWISQVLSKYDEICAAGWSPLQTLNEESAETRLRCRKIRNTVLSSEPSAASNTLKQQKAASLLISHVELSLLIDEAAGLPVLQDLVTGFERTYLLEHKKGNKSSKNRAQEAMEEDGPVYVEVITDVLLSLLVNPSQLYRELAKLVFNSFSDIVTETVLLDIMEVITRKKLRPGENDEEESDDEFEPFENSDDESGEEVDMKVDSGSLKLKAPQSNKRKRSAEDDSDDSEEEDEEDDDEVLSMKDLNGILDSELTPEELAAVQNAQSEDPNATMDVYDSQLSNMIRLRKSQLNAKKEEQEQLLHFQLRCTDLIEIFMRKHGDSPLIYSLYLPMLTAIDKSRESSTLVLHERLVSLFKNRLCGNKSHPKFNYDALESKKKAKVQSNVSESNEVSLTFLHQLVESLFAQAYKTQSRQTLSLISEALVYLTRISTPPAPSHPAHISYLVSKYSDALTSYMTQRRSHLNTKFFDDFINRFPSLAWQFALPLTKFATVHQLIDKLDNSKPSKQAKSRKLTENTSAKQQELNAVTAFRRNECFTLLHSLFTRCKSLKLESDSDIQYITEVESSMQFALESGLKYASLTLEEKDALEPKSGNAQDDKMDDENAEESSETTKVTDNKKVSAKEKKKLKMQMKRKKKKQKLVETAKHVESSKKSTEAAEFSRAVNRLKSAFRAAHAFKSLKKKQSSPGDSADNESFGNGKLQQTIRSLPTEMLGNLKVLIKQLSDTLSAIVDEKTATSSQQQKKSIKVAPKESNKKGQVQPSKPDQQKKKPASSTSTKAQSAHNTEKGKTPTTKSK